MSEFTKQQQYRRVRYIGVCFMVMFTSYGSLQNFVSKMYDQYNFKNMGQTAVMSIYASFAISTIFSSFIVKKLGYKKSMFYASLGYAIFQSTGLLIATQISIQRQIIWICVVCGAIICGISAGVLWVAHGAYISLVADENSKSEMFGLFWAWMMVSQIFGNLLITFVLGKLSNLTYFMLLSILGFSSSFLFLFVPTIPTNPNPSLPQQAPTISQQLKKVYKMTINKKYRYLQIYYWFTGVSVSFYAGFLYKLVLACFIKNQYQNQIDFNQKINFYAGIVFIMLGACQVSTGIFMNLYAEKFCKFKLAVVGTLLVQLASFTSIVCYYQKSYGLAIICAAFWGASETFISTNTNGLTSKLFAGKVEAFSTFRICSASGVVCILLLGIILGNANILILITIILIGQIFVTGAAINIKDLDPKINISQDCQSTQLVGKVDHDQ